MAASDDELTKARKARTLAKRYETQGKLRLAEAWENAAKHHLDEAIRLRALELTPPDPSPDSV